MNQSRISVRYARAIFQLALDKNLLESVNRDMILVSEICRFPETKDFLSNPVIRPSVKEDIFHKMIGGKIQEITMSLIDLTIKNGRESYIPAIARVFIHETKKHNGITDSVLTTSVKADEKIKSQIRDMISAEFKTKVDLKDNIDPDIIGGFILQIGDNYIDASVKNKLRKIKKELIGSVSSSR